MTDLRIPYCPHGHVPATCTACYDARSVELLRERIKDLEAALEPFALFAKKWDEKPIRGLDDVIYGIHAGTEWAAELRLSDCHNAGAVLTGEAGRGRPVTR